MSKAFLPLGILAAAGVMGSLAGGQGSPARRRYIRPEVEEHYIQGVRDPAFVLRLTRPQQLALWWYANTLSGPQAVRIQEIVELHQAGELPTVDRDWVNPSHPGRSARGRRSARGGNAIGHTSSGKPIYASKHEGKGHFHKKYRGYTRRDHFDAAKLHEEHAQHSAKAVSEIREKIKDSGGPGSVKTPTAQQAKLRKEWSTHLAKKTYHSAMAGAHRSQAGAEIGIAPKAHVQRHERTANAFAESAGRQHGDAFARGRRAARRYSHPGGFDALTHLIRTFRFQSMPKAQDSIFVNATLTDADISFSPAVRLELGMLLASNGYDPTVITENGRTKFNVELYEPGYRKRPGSATRGRRAKIHPVTGLERRGEFHYFKLGTKAYREGAARKDNPFKGWQAKWWDKGWAGVRPRRQKGRAARGRRDPMPPFRSSATGESGWTKFNASTWSWASGEGPEFVLRKPPNYGKWRVFYTPQAKAVATFSVVAQGATAEEAISKARKWYYAHIPGPGHTTGRDKLVAQGRRAAPTTAERRQMGQKLQALPWSQASALYRRNHPEYKGIGGYPMNTKLRASGARSYGVAAYNAGKLTKKDVEIIFRRTSRRYPSMPKFDAMVCKTRKNGKHRNCKSVTSR